MKKIRVTLLISLILPLFLNASEWEGSASASVDGDLPSSGFFAATNSFPRNTSIEVTNLENGRSVKAVVSQSLDAPGLLVVLSREAAEAIGLNPHSLGRVLMSQSAEPVIGHLSETVFTPGDPDHDPAASVRARGGLDPSLRREMEELLAEGIAEGSIPSDYVIPSPAGHETVAQVPPSYTDHYFYLEPTEHRIPASPEPYIDPKDMILPLDQYPKDFYPENLYPNPPVDSYPTNRQQGDVYPQRPEREYAIDPSDVITPVRETVPRPQPAPPGVLIIPSVPAEASVRVDLPTERNFSVPVITNLDRGRYYIQVAAGAEAEGIESEIRKIGRSYPLAVQPTGSAERPLYRLLIGPVNLGESGALLERFKALYKDAFVLTGA